MKQSFPLPLSQAREVREIDPFPTWASPVILPRG